MGSREQWPSGPEQIFSAFPWGLLDDGRGGIGGGVGGWMWECEEMGWGGNGCVQLLLRRPL